jgi:hypothetical protein
VFPFDGSDSAAAPLIATSQYGSPDTLEAKMFGYAGSAASSKKIDRNGKTLAQKKVEVQRALSDTSTSSAKSRKNATGHSSTKK